MATKLSQRKPRSPLELNGYGPVQKLKLKKLDRYVLETFQGIEDPQAARMCEFEFYGGDGYILIVEPTTVQIHDNKGNGRSWGIFSEDLDINMQAYAIGMLRMIQKGRVGSEQDFSSVLRLEQLS